MQIAKPKENCMSQAILTGRSKATIDSTGNLYSPVYQAYRLLHVAFVVAPIVAGLDKFSHLLVDWDKYLAPIAGQVLGGHGHEFMLAVGVIEIVAGIGVLLKPRIFAYVVAVWLLGIIVNLLLIQGYYDIALRDVGLCLAAIALGRLSAVYDR
jgi:uncharacterized membrane protein YphA (DoxX/SURF4 family)